MTIGSINIAMGASYGAYQQKLTQATKQKLEELNIPYNSNVTEKEAQKLIKAYQAQKEDSTKKNSLSQDSSSKDSLLEKAKKLAEKLGIQTEENPNFNQLLALIEQTLEIRINSSKDNVQALKELQNLSYELSSIQAQANGSSGYDNTNRALLQSLEMLSLYNQSLIKN